jgi:hypothetical protein
VRDLASDEGESALHQTARSGPDRDPSVQSAPGTKVPRREYRFGRHLVAPCFSVAIAGDDETVTGTARISTVTWSTSWPARRRPGITSTCRRSRHKTDVVETGANSGISHGGAARRAWGPDARVTARKPETGSAIRLRSALIFFPNPTTRTLKVSSFPGWANRPPARALFH